MSTTLVQAITWRPTGAKSWFESLSRHQDRVSFFMLPISHCYSHQPDPVLSTQIFTVFLLFPFLLFLFPISSVLLPLSCVFFFCFSWYFCSIFLFPDTFTTTRLLFFLLPFIMLLFSRARLQLFPVPFLTPSQLLLPVIFFIPVTPFLPITVNLFLFPFSLNLSHYWAKNSRS